MNRFFLSLAALPFLSACATAPAPLPPLTTYDRVDCHPSPDLTQAVSLTPLKDKRVWVVNNPIGQGDCLSRDGAMGPYVVYELPTHGTAQLIELGSLLEGARIFSPTVVLMDEGGRETRVMKPEHYMFRSNLYSIQFQPTEHERYALVTVDPNLIGERYEAILAGTNSTMVCYGYGCSNWRSGSETQLSQGFSYSGTLLAKVYRPEKERN